MIRSITFQDQVSVCFNRLNQRWVVLMEEEEVEELGAGRPGERAVRGSS